jgi:heat shock protein HslJ
MTTKSPLRSAFGIAAPILLLSLGCANLALAADPVEAADPAQATEPMQAAVPEQPVALTARGNEPFWQIEVSDKAISFRTMDGETFTIEPVPQPVATDGGETYSATVDGQPFTLTVVDTVCTDTMSGMPHPKTVSVVLGERRLEGCGGQPADLLHGDWRIEEIGGKAVVAKSEPTLAFTTDGSINGNASCNRFFGSFSLTGEGLTFSDAATTMMACDQPIMDQEHALLEAFKTVRRFEVTAEGRLNLLGDEAGTLIGLSR